MVGDEASLYQALAPRLERIVGREIRAPRAVIEDACQHAWAQLITHSDTVSRDGVLSWLAVTAQRRAVRLARREARELSLEQHIEHHQEPADPSRRADPEQAALWRSELDRLKAISERQRGMLWLQAIGLTYTEIAARTGDSERTVERQLLRARHALESVEDKAPDASPDVAPRIGEPAHQPGLQPSRVVDRRQRTVRP